MKKKPGSKKFRKTDEISLTEEQANEFLRIVRDDLLFLQSLNYERPTRTEVRFVSLVLRRLLVENMYMNAWVLSGFDSEPGFIAIDLAEMVSGLQPHHVQYAYAGGAKTHGASYTGYVLLSVPKLEHEPEGPEATAKNIVKLVKPGSFRSFSLREFCNSPAVISGTSTISRMGLVRYVANKLGGVHWDPLRADWNDPAGSRHRFLDERHLIVGRLPAPLYELISVAQSIATSKDTTNLITYINQHAPEDEQAINTIRFREGRIGKYTDMTFNSSGSSENNKAP